MGQIEPQLGGLLARLTALGEVSQSSQRLLVAGDRVPLGVAQRGQDSRLGEIDDGLGPGFALPVVGAQGERVGLERPGVEGFERLRHPAVEKRAARGDELTVHHLADAVVRELEALAAAVQDPMAHQLLDAFRDLGLAEIGRPLQQGEVEGPADHRRDGQQAPASVAEPLQAVRDQVADTLGKRQRRRVLGQGAPAQGAQRLDDHEGVSAAGRPDLLLEARDGGELHQHARQGRRVLTGEGAERQPAQVASAQLVQRVPQEGGLQEILVPHGGDGEQAPSLQAPACEGQEPEAHLIGPVEVLEDQDGGLSEGHSLQELSHGLEELGGIGGGGARRRAGRDLGEQPGQLRAPDRTEPVERLAVGGETTGAQDIDPRPEREHLFRLEAPAEQDARAFAAGLGDQLGDQAALADAGLAHHGDELTLAGERGLQRVPEVRQLDLAAHDGSLAGQRVRVEQPFHSGARGAGASGVRRGRRRVSRLPFQDLLVQRPRLVIGLGSQLALERRHTELVLAESGPAPAELRVQAHERPVHRFLEGIEGHQPQTRSARPRRARRRPAAG